ncbi:MAG: hypothetical protein FJW35_17000, partial [Acidobacteria bacterium]|nr:hypothetical protein [Acidobacteriota bacterium]
QKIVQAQKEISEVPARVEAFRSELRTLTEEHERKVTRSQELGRKRRADEGEVDLMRSKLSRLKDQLMSVKTNKEYQAMLHEIQGAEDQIRKAEDEILEIMEEMEATDAALKGADLELRSQTAVLENHIRTAEASVPRLEAEVTRLSAEKASLEQRIPEELLERYRRIAGHRKGIAMAETKDELCTMCHVRIRPQVYADLRQGETIHACDSCSRILFLRDIP